MKKEGMKKRMIDMTKYSGRLALIMAGAISLSLCGCEMVNGNSAQGEARTTYIYGDSIQEDAGASLRAKLGVPDSCKTTFGTGKSRLSEISLDTDDIDVPGTDRAYIVGFDRIELTQEKIQSMVEGVFDKSEGIYCRDDGDENMTKEEIQQGIDLIEAYRDQALKEGKTDVADMYDSDIAAEKIRMASAPDTYRPVAEYTSDKIYVGQNDGDKFSLWISGGDNDEGASGVSVEYSADASRDQNYLANVPDAVVTETVGEADSGVDAGDEQNVCSLDENSARIMAQEFLDKIGISGMAFRSSQAVIRTWLDGSMTCIKTKKNGYVFQFGRQIAGIPVVYEDPTGVDNLKKDSVFGEPFLLPEESQHYYVCAKSETRVLFIAYEHVIKRCENACKFHSQLVSNLLQMIALRASQQASRIYVLSRNSIRKKIMTYLNSIAAEKQTKTVILPMSYTTLAEYLSVDRSAMMREMKNLVDEGIIERDGKKLRILESKSS